MQTNQSLQDLFNISDNQITTYPVVINNEHKADFSDDMQNPLGYFVHGQRDKLREYIGYISKTPKAYALLHQPYPKTVRSDYKLQPNQLVLQFVRYKSHDSWLFIGCFDHEEIDVTPNGFYNYYPLTLNAKFSEYVGRLVVHYKRHQGDMGRIIKKTDNFKRMTVLTILPEPYVGD
ncbi:hypothetical protein AYR62_05500 [Secundilactobacillus paracollinoides]|uniref:Uncharacterized protein n=1 Tax=Secundilactobacillus paracollinoides TaxID=240427 RepID=A0A1B2J0M5_9LACO|nr:hypothetical protein [Secundilactobacillus paracollinoides]ANZ63601.1 hypothetical protein AYR62_05500 [Secundilactobacillus paracollinoides]ANZ67861.1 hypothetical protein AYR63_12410 [Secundilactobacillus paracollinoides]